jgi:hypothetical protein
VPRSALSATYSDVHAQLADVTSKLQALATSPSRAAAGGELPPYLSPSKSPARLGGHEAQACNDEGAPPVMLARCARPREASWPAAAPEPARCAMPLAGPRAAAALLLPLPQACCPTKRAAALAP